MEIDKEMDMTPDMDFVAGYKYKCWFTTITDIPKDFFTKYVKGKRFLDVGCGDGRVVTYAMRCGASKYRGIDNDAKFIQSSNIQRYLTVGDLHDIDFNKYDVLYYYLGSDLKEPELIKKFKDFEGVIILMYRKLEHRLKDFHESMIKQGFKDIENIKLIRVYKKGVKK